MRAVNGKGCVCTRAALWRKTEKRNIQKDEGLPNIENREIIWTPSYYKKWT